jgi:hypothetical protein
LAVWGKSYSGDGGEAAVEKKAKRGLGGMR